jgi:hypothetical protein
MKPSIRLTELRCVCGAALRVRWNSASTPSLSKYRFRCSRCDAVRPALGSIVGVSRYQDGGWKRLEAAEWGSPPWRGRPSARH